MLKRNSAEKSFCICEAILGRAASEDGANDYSLCPDLPRRDGDMERSVFFRFRITLDFICRFLSTPRPDLEIQGILDLYCDS